MKTIECDITGVYATVHADEGEFTTGLPIRMKVNGETIGLEFYVESAPFDGTLRTMTYHFGIKPAKVRIEPPVRVRKRDSVTLYGAASFEYLKGTGDA